MIKRESKLHLYLTALFIMLGLTIGTGLHDPVLHGLIAYINGWTVTSYSSGFIVGSTDVTGSDDISTWGKWWFYMLPSIFIFTFVFVVTLVNPHRLLRILGIVLIGLNLPSLSPEISSSDASQSINILILAGWDSMSAYALHWLLYLIAILVWILYLYIINDDNMKDVQSRISNIF